MVNIYKGGSDIPLKFSGNPCLWVLSHPLNDLLHSVKEALIPLKIDLRGLSYPIEIEIIGLASENGAAF